MYGKLYGFHEKDNGKTGLIAAWCITRSTWLDCVVGARYGGIRPRPNFVQVARCRSKWASLSTVSPSRRANWSLFSIFGHLSRQRASSKSSHNVLILVFSRLIFVSMFYSFNFDVDSLFYLNINVRFILAWNLLNIYVSYDVNHYYDRISQQF